MKIPMGITLPAVFTNEAVQAVKNYIKNTVYRLFDDGAVFVTDETIWLSTRLFYSRAEVIDCALMNVLPILPYHNTVDCLGCYGVVIDGNRVGEVCFTGWPKMAPPDVDFGCNTTFVPDTPVSAVEIKIHIEQDANTGNKNHTDRKQYKNEPGVDPGNGHDHKRRDNT